MTELERMQAEAVNSARAMYRRRTPVRTVQPQPEPEPEPEPTPAEEPQQEELTGSPTESGILSSLFEDKEKTLIILLIILLSEDGADIGVIMALMYCII